MSILNVTNADPILYSYEVEAIDITTKEKLFFEMKLIFSNVDESQIQVYNIEMEAYNTIEKLGHDRSKYELLRLSPVGVLYGFL